LSKIHYIRLVILCKMNTKGVSEATTDDRITRVFEPVSLYPVVALRLGFGASMALWTLYMVFSGAVNDLFITPDFHFSYPGFEWVRPLPDSLIYVAFGVLFVSSIMLFAGWHFRWASWIFTLVFAYVTLMDKASYLSYYYFVLLLGFMLSLSPAHRLFSIDLIRKPSIRVDYVPFWLVLAFKVQVALVFISAGMAKLNVDWLFKGMPVNIWIKDLAEQGFSFLNAASEGSFPIVIAWILITFDFVIPHFLLDKRTSKGAFLLVVLMQILALFVFQAGFFPVLIAFSCLVFLPEDFVHRFLSRVSYFLYDVFDFRGDVFNQGGSIMLQFRKKKVFPVLLAVFFSLQILIPVALFLNWGSRRWADSAFRFSWDIRMHEKTGKVEFFLQDENNGSSATIPMNDYLTVHQIRMMAEDPDMIRQFAEFLLKQNAANHNIKIHANASVSLNGRPPELLVQDSWSGTDTE
jgi:hypothetical protein